ncbi:hypothetical protein SKAU_G00050830 [Synaphobranchus kaupii]|uniref:Uncharacterized protein n=1 Tax=Synaphobranchus kaupii TaxID=118154 RepID=A0A9Q1G3U3_SYNKA|nr:hypothetical protein SKAU_G00050830 [Synaphobranchus kaupii]
MDWLFGEQLPEVMNPRECRDKFKADRCPRTMPEAQAEQIQVVMEGNSSLSSIWVISDHRAPHPTRTGPRVAFGKII